jgi:hypothetical protein
VWDYSHVLEAKNCKCPCLLVSYQDTDIAVICSIFLSIRRIPWNVPYDRPNLPANSEIVPHESSLTILWTFFMLLSVRHVEGWPESSQTSTEVLHISIEKNHSKASSSHAFSEWELLLQFYAFPVDSFWVRSNTNTLFLRIKNYTITCITLSTCWYPLQRVIAA